jgi:FHA domain-containing protein
MILDPLVVRIIDTVTGESWVYVFHVGPVSIGCGLDASLPIVRPLVSAQHGSFQFDDRSVRYQDHDPQNGTLVDGAATRGREKIVTDWTQIEIGNVRITTSRRLPDKPIPDPSLSPFGRLPGGSAVPPRPQDAAVPRGRQELSGAPSAPAPRPSSPAPPPANLRARPSRHRTGSPAVERPPRRRVRSGFSVLAWLSAIALGLVVVGAAALVLQFSGVRWMPPELVARIPTWLAEWSSQVLGHRDPSEGGHRDPATPVERPEPPRPGARANAPSQPRSSRVPGRGHHSQPDR